MNLANLVGISIIILVLLLFLYFQFKEELLDNEKDREKVISFEYLLEDLKETINNIQNTNLSELNLSKVEMKKREEQKMKLYKAVKYSCTGDLGHKLYLKDYMCDLLLRKYNINERNIDLILGYNKPNNISPTDKFYSLLYIYGKMYHKEAFSKLCYDFQLIKDKYRDGQIYYSITKEEIEQAYRQGGRKLRFIEKLDRLTQKLYENYVGHGVIDTLREEVTIDGIAGGVSGNSNLIYDFMEEQIYNTNSNGVKKNQGQRYDSIWIFYQGKPVHLEFMSFQSQKELERVIHNLYRNNNPGWLSSLKGYMVNDTKDGDRVTCVRPPFSESFSFWIRKFQSTRPTSLESLFQDKGVENLFLLLKFLVLGCAVIVITGEQNCGKTTLLKSLVQFIDNRYPIRTLETFFELWLSKLYPEKNISGFHNTDSISSGEAISLMKKTDGSVLIAGESADFVTAAKVVELSLVGTKMTMSTNHAMTTEGLIEYHANSMMSREVGLYSDDYRAEKSVVKALNIDIHMVKDVSGKRYIERITEIVPIEHKSEVLDNMDSLSTEECFRLWIKSQLNKNTYKTVDLLRYNKDGYQFLNPISDRLRGKMEGNMGSYDKESFIQWHKGFEVNHG